MPTTGVDFDNHVFEVTDGRYSGYFPAPSKNDIYKEALLKTYQNKCDTNDKSKIKDELFTLKKTEAVYPISGNRIALNVGGAGIPDYFHWDYVLTKFVVPQAALVTGATNATPVVLTLNARTNFRDGENLVISGITGNTNANGNYFIRQLNTYQFALYTDAKLINAVTGNAPYIAGGVISKVYYNSADYIESFRKVSNFSTATVQAPRFEVSNGVMTLLPFTENCTEITLDYYHYPQTFIDCLDGVFNLETLYPSRLLLDIADKSAELMGMYSRSRTLAQNAQKELNSQP